MGKNGKVRSDPTSKADCTDSKADKVQVQKRDRSTSVPKRVQILPPRPSSISAPSASSPPAARSRTSSAKERPRMATQLHIPVSARLSSRRARNANTAMEKSFSARELSRCLADVGRHDFKKPFWSNFLMMIAEIAISTAIWMGAMVWDACDHILHVGNPSQLVKELALFFMMFFLNVFDAFWACERNPVWESGGLDVPGPIWNCCLFHNGRGELFGLTCPHLEPNLRKWKGFRAHENNFCWSFAHGISEYCITPKRNPGLVLDLFL